jgi:hypothetical protein
MGKSSKFQVKVNTKIKSEDYQLGKKVPRKKYYDEKIEQKGGISKGMFVFMVGMIIIGGLTGIGLLIAKNMPSSYNPNDTQTTTADPNLFIEDGDLVVFQYTLWAAPRDSGVDGVINLDTPIQGPLSYETLIRRGYDLPSGVYLALLNMKSGNTKEFNLTANIDANGDFIDDVTGLDVLSFGNPIDIEGNPNPFYNANIKYRILILQITKSE